MVNYLIIKNRVYTRVLTHSPLRGVRGRGVLRDEWHDVMEEGGGVLISFFLSALSDILFYQHLTITFLSATNFKINNSVSS